MRKFFVPAIPLLLGLLLSHRAEALDPADTERVPPSVSLSPAQGPRDDPIDMNLIIDGSRFMEGPGGDAAAWLCEYVVDGMLQPGDYLRIWIAGDKVLSLYGAVLGEGDREAVKALIRRPLPGSKTADFEGALRAVMVPPAGASRSPLMTYTLLVSSPEGLSPVHLGAALSHLRFSRVMEFPGWRALVIALDIGPQVREAAGSFLSGR
ncbi:MAG: hypothetical protein LBL70_00365 [Treponema sp.]|nr:hypothetical protein [Treponema sp.]